MPKDQKIKNHLLLLVVLIICFTVSSFSAEKRETIVICNYTSQTVIITGELSEANENFDPESLTRIQNIQGITVYNPYETPGKGYLENKAQWVQNEALKILNNKGWRYGLF